MKFTRLPSIVVCAATLLLVAFVIVTALRDAAFAQLAADGGDIKDRIAIQEKLLYAYAYAYDVTRRDRFPFRAMRSSD